MIKTYNELVRLESFKERFDYLKLKGIVGKETFGFDRFLNQTLYRSRQWAKIRDLVIIRDSGCDLGVPGYEIHDKIIVHHMNPISVEDLEDGDPKVFDINYLVCVSNNTHLAIHYGDGSLLPKEPVVRRPHDTTPWR